MLPRLCAGELPTDILTPDKVTCAIFKGGWVEKVRGAVAKVNPELHS